MKKPVFPKKHAPAVDRRIAFQGGSYALIITAVVLAILVVVNVLVSALPATWTKLDISSSQLYSVTSNTKAVVNNLSEDVTIYWIVQADQEDEILSNLLAKYDSLSDHISVVKRNPDVYPTFAEQYTDETVSNNSLVVECGEKSRYIPYSDIYLTETDLYYGYSTISAFDGEGAITSAIDYVVSDELPQVYQLEGHGEAELPSTFADQLEKDNYELQTLSLLNIDEIPEDASCLMIYGPESDISEDEAAMLQDYVAGGGKLLVLAGTTEKELPNLQSLLNGYGVTVAEGVVVEGDRTHYVSAPVLLMPDLQSSPITASLLEEHYYPTLSAAQGLSVGTNAVGATVTELLTTSDQAFSKTAGLEIETYDKEDGDVDGPFALAVSIEDASGGQLVWFGSSSFLDDVYNAYSSGANVNLVMNALANLVGEREALSIRSKSLTYNYLTISDSTASLLKVLMIGVFPLVYLGIGIGVVVGRRKRQHEAV